MANNSSNMAPGEASAPSLESVSDTVRSMRASGCSTLMFIPTFLSDQIVGYSYIVFTRRVVLNFRNLPSVARWAEDVEYTAPENEVPFQDPDFSEIEGRAEEEEQVCSCHLTFLLSDSESDADDNADDPSPAPRPNPDVHDGADAHETSDAQNNLQDDDAEPEEDWKSLLEALDHSDASGPGGGLRSPAPPPPAPPNSPASFWTPPSPPSSSTGGDGNEECPGPNCRFCLERRAYFIPDPPRVDSAHSSGGLPGSPDGSDNLPSAHAPSLEPVPDNDDAEVVPDADAAPREVSPDLVEDEEDVFREEDIECDWDCNCARCRQMRLESQEEPER
ncbi:hypothetical protein K402DRAFT_28160 [Aulographum hederae CBS 113979]|uniref:Uncharacterized protein n=1 Tax=Aulographum hederae CBS 113979 TaxID=1176131 RepID=A0A6G1H5Y2_9PEZI|nr:hypothetical protein K402DRAFT_28160 [Aulographum hederae CBS 113979]